MLFDFANQVVMVTGGSGNLGGAVVRAFHGANARLVVPDRAEDRLPALFPMLADHNDHYLASSVDVGVPDQVEQLVAETVRRFGKIDILVNTVGGYRAGQPLHETSLETWDGQMNLNARTVFITCHAVLPVMLSQQHGKIVNVAANPAQKGIANASAYSASKSAVARMTESMAAEYKRKGITVNAVLPGQLDTPQNRQASPDADFSLWIQPDALAQIILFLASDTADIIQGTLIPVTGRQ